MANPTTNYGFVLPTASDLVTDLPADFDIALQGVDTRLKALQPGTTLGDLAYSSATANTNTRLPIGTSGQVLAVSGGGVPAWTTTADVTPLTTKGDLFTFTTVDARLAVGANGESLVADSSTSTGLRWQGSAIGKNAAINGACEIAQRGTSAVTLTAASFLYPVDRFFAGRSSGTTGATAQQFTSTSLDGFQYGVRVQRTAANTSTNDLYIGQSFETSNSIPFANKTVVVSFWARSGANYSPTSSALNVRFYTGTGTDQSGLGSAFTGSATPISQTATLTTSWQRFQYTATLASTATQMQFLAFCTPTGTAGAADNFDITGLQVELGSIATPFARTGGTIQGELAACQRYYFRTTATTQYDRFTTYSPAGSTTNLYAANFVVPVQMRVKPTTIDFSNLTWYDGLSVGTTVSAVTISSNATPTNAALDVVTTGMVQYRPVALMSNTTSGFLGIGAEL